MCKVSIIRLVIWTVCTFKQNIILFISRFKPFSLLSFDCKCIIINIFSVWYNKLRISLFVINNSHRWKGKKNTIINFPSILDFSILQNLKGSAFGKSTDMSFHHLNSSFLIFVFSSSTCLTRKICISLMDGLCFGRALFFCVLQPRALTLGRSGSWWTVYEYEYACAVWMPLHKLHLTSVDESRYSSWRWAGS